MRRTGNNRRGVMIRSGNSRRQPEQIPMQKRKQTKSSDDLPSSGAVDSCPTCGQKIKVKRKCPKCESENVVMFSADDDICMDCKHTF